MTNSPYAGARVVCRFDGTGRVWPSGRHVRSGEVLKRGPAGGWLVRILAPIPERQGDGTWSDSHIITCSDNEMEVVS